MRIRNLCLAGIAACLAIVVGCGSDPAATILSSTGGTTPQAVDFTPMTATQSAQAVGTGTAQDASTANQTADGLSSVLTGGAVDAATISGSSSSSSSAAETLPQRSGHQVKVGFSSASHAVATATSGPIQILDGNVVVNDSSGTYLTISGVTVTTDTTSGRPTTIILSGSERIVGTAPLGNDWSHNVDVRINGISGSISPPTTGTGSPVVSLTISSSGASVSGEFGPIAGEVDLTGVSGYITSLADLNALFASHTLNIVVPQFQWVDILTSLKGQASIVNLNIPQGSSSSGPTGSIHGQVDATLDSKVAFTKDGRVQRLTANVDQSTPIVFDTAHNGPASGTAQVALYFRSGVRDNVTITIVDGRAQLTGTVTNITGQGETVDEDGGQPRVQGQVKFADGRTAEHEIHVVQGPSGRQITFSITIKDSSGNASLTLTGAIHADHSIAGAWSRTQPAASGAFRVSVAGLLEVLDGSSNVLAHVQLPTGWDKSL